MRKVALIFCLILATPIFFVACEKKDPQPELRDPIYLDLISQLSLSSKSLDEELKMLADHKAKLAEVVPQTRQIDFAKRRVFDSESRVHKYQQQIKYWKIRIFSRIKYARRSYEQAFAQGRPWPDPKEFQIYQAEKRLRAARLQWDINQRLEAHQTLATRKPSSAAE